MCTRTIKVITGNITNWEEDMFEQEMKEETVNEIGVLDCSCKVRNVDEESGDSEAWWVFFDFDFDVIREKGCY